MREEIIKIIDNNWNKGVFKCDETSDQILSLIKSKLMEAMPKEKDLDTYGYGQYNEALKDYQEVINKLME